MANYTGKTRTNYFSVIDEIRLKEIIDVCIATAEVRMIKTTGCLGDTRYGFICDGCISGLPYTLDDSGPVAVYSKTKVDDVLDINVCWELFCKALQEIIPDNEAVIITEVGSEAIRYFSAYSIVVTKRNVHSIDLRDKAIELARDMLGNKLYSTKMEY